MSGLAPHIFKASPPDFGSILTSEGERTLLAFDRDVGSESSLIRLSRETDAVVLRRSSSGETRIYDKGGVVICKGRQWSFKESSESAFKLVVRQAPMVPRQVLAELIDYAYHELSPRQIGATLIWFLRESKIEGGNSLGMSLSVMSAVDRQLLAEFLGLFCSTRGFPSVDGGPRRETTDVMR